MALGTVRMRSAPGSTPSGAAVTLRILRAAPVAPRALPGGPCATQGRCPDSGPFAGLRYDQVRPPRQGHRPSLRRGGTRGAGRAGGPAHRQRHPRRAPRAGHPHAGLDKYQHAAHLFSTWRQEGLLVPDAPAFYAYRMTVPGGGTTTGVIGALGCEPPGGDILPHEQTIPKDKSDRLDLLRACRANLSPIWGLSLSRGAGHRVRTRGAAPRRGRRRRRGDPRAVGPRRARVIEEITRGGGGRAGGDRRRPSPLRDRAHLPGRATRRARRGDRATTTWSWRSWSSWPRASCRSAPSTGPSPASPPGSTWRSCSAGSSTPCTPGPPTTSSWNRWRGPGPSPSSPAAACAC